MPTSNVVDQMKTYFVQSHSPSTSWVNAVSLYLSLPRLRAFWAISSANETHDLYDLSGQGRTLSRGHAAVSDDMAVMGLAVCVDATAASSQRWSRADEAGLDILAAAYNDTGLTIGAWLRFHTESEGIAAGVLGKWLAAGDQRAYRLIKNSSDQASFSVSSDGTLANVVTATNTDVTMVKNTWYFLAGVMTPSVSLDCWVDLDKYSNAVGVPANIADTTATLYLARNDAGDYLDGRIAFPFLCAAPLSDTIIRSIYHQTRALFNK